jgi:TM2 domain-containing membrane protein YozV
MALAFVFPGAGHFYLGRRRRAVAFAAIIISMFVYGLLLDGKIYVAQPGQPLTFLAMLGSMGSGLLYFVTRLIGAPGDVASITYEYGTAFTLSAGIFNLLLVLDSFDIALGRKE